MLLAPCGIDCDECKFKGECEGCHAIEGKPFYIQDFGMDTCPMYDCPVNQKGYKTCAQCSELPCKTYYDWKDPSMTDEAHLQSIKDRVKVLNDSLLEK